MRSRAASFIFVFIAFSLALFPIQAFKVTGVSVSVSETEYKGFCPHRFIFTGRITTNREGTVRYTWVRSDGAPRKTFTLDFPAAGTQIVTYEWELGGPMGKYKNYWAQIEVLAPNSKTSNQAEFDLECIPKFVAERKIYTVSGRLIAYAGQAAFLEALEGCQLKVCLSSGGRVVKEQVVGLNRGGNSGYSLVLINAPGRYVLTVEPVHLTERMIWQRSDPANYAIELTEASPEANNKNFTYYYALTGML